MKLRLFWVIIVLFAFASVSERIKIGIQFIILYSFVLHLSFLSELLSVSLLRAYPSLFECFQIVSVLLQNRIEVNYSSDFMLFSVLTFVFLAEVYRSLGPLHRIIYMMSTQEKYIIFVDLYQVVNNLRVLSVIWFLLALQQKAKSFISIMCKLLHLFVGLFFPFEYSLQYFELLNEVNSNSLPQILKMQLKMLPIGSKFPLIIDQMHNIGYPVHQPLLYLVISCQLTHIFFGKVNHEVDQIEQHVFDHENSQDHVFTHKFFSVSIILGIQGLGTEVYLGRVVSLQILDPAVLDTVKELNGVVVVCWMNFVGILDELLDDDGVGLAVNASDVQQFWNVQKELVVDQRFVVTG